MFLCLCGCGKETNIYRGKFRKFLKGHWAKLRNKNWIEQLSKSNSGNKNPFYGKHHIEKSKEKISGSNIGRKDSPETKKLKSLSKLGEKNSFYKKKHSEKSKIKISENHFNVSGKNNPSWKGGITPLNNQIRHCDEYFEWRSSVFKRDSYTCQECGINNSHLEAHHIKSFQNILKDNNITTFESSLNCKELWNLDNGITLCEECHMKTDNYKGKNKNRGVN